MLGKLPLPEKAKYHLQTGYCGEETVTILEPLQCYVPCLGVIHTVDYDHVHTLSVILPFVGCDWF